MAAPHGELCWRGWPWWVVAQVPAVFQAHLRGLRFCSSSDCWDIQQLQCQNCAGERAATGAGDRAGVHRHASVFGGFQKNFLSRFSCSRCSHLEILCIITLWPRILAVTRPVSGCCILEYRIGFFERFCGYSGATLGSTVDKRSASVLGAFRRITNFFHAKWTRILRCSVSVRRMETCAQADASASSPGTVLALGNPEITSTRFTWLAVVMMVDLSQ